MNGVRVLRSKEDFNRVFKSHQHKFFIKGFLLLACTNNVGYTRLGMVVAKKSVKLAVRRNAIKRRLRANFDLVFGRNGPPLDCVVVVHKSVAGLSLAAVNQAVASLFGQLREEAV